MKVKKILAILALPFMCLLSSCKEEPIVYGNKSIYERPVNYQGLYWLGDKIDINNDDLYQLEPNNSYNTYSNYSRVFAEHKYINQSGEIPNVQSDISLIRSNSQNPFILYHITKGYKKSGDESKYYVTGVSIIKMNCKDIFGVDYYSDVKEIEKKMAEYSCVPIIYPNFPHLNGYNYISNDYCMETYYCFNRLVIDICNVSNDFMFTSKDEAGYDGTIFANENEPGILIPILKNSWFDENFKN